MKEPSNEETITEPQTDATGLVGRLEAYRDHAPELTVIGAGEWVFEDASTEIEPLVVLLRSTAPVLGCEGHVLYGLEGFEVSVVYADSSPDVVGAAAIDAVDDGLGEFSEWLGDLHMLAEYLDMALHVTAMPTRADAEAAHRAYDAAYEVFDAEAGSERAIGQMRDAQAAPRPDVSVARTPGAEGSSEYERGYRGATERQRGRMLEAMRRASDDAVRGDPVAREGLHLLRDAVDCLKRIAEALEAR